MGDRHIKVYKLASSIDGTIYGLEQDNRWKQPPTTCVLFLAGAAILALCACVRA